MVLRKDRSQLPATDVSETVPIDQQQPRQKTMSTGTEQPVTKRQRIDDQQSTEQTADSPPPPPDLNSLSSGQSSIASSSTSLASTSGQSSTHSNQSIIDPPSTGSGTDELDNYNGIVLERTDFHLEMEPPKSTDFQDAISEQCLCRVNEQILKRTFPNHYSRDGVVNGRTEPLMDWPNQKLLQFLSNVQLLFDVYLKQNIKGNICYRIMGLCYTLIRNDTNLIDEIIDLCNYNNKYVEYLASKLLASFLVIAKDNLDTNWLKKLVDHLFATERIDLSAIRKISFSLEIFRRVIEWRDIDNHPLDTDPIESVGQLPPIEQNYFAIPLNVGAGIGTERSTERQQSSIVIDDGCHRVQLSDSESFDTTRLKCDAVKILENKWPALVTNMSRIIDDHRTIDRSESVIITFIVLWENIISVQANLSVIETLPFYAQLENFTDLLYRNLSPTIYKQMLSLFNEALCYGSTLSLQDLIPDETCKLAHKIVRKVRFAGMLDSLPKRRPQNPVSFIGYQGETVHYTSGEQSWHQTDTPDDHIVQMDKTILQKMVLLILKSVAVTVKEIRSDSSDSAIDSSDGQAFEDMELIERSIRDVLKKLENYMKHTLEFHPDSHFSKILIHLFVDQDDNLIEAMVCTLDVTAGFSFQNNKFRLLVDMLNPIFTFLEFLKVISNSYDFLLDLLVSNETCFLLYLLRFLKYIRANWSMMVTSCQVTSEMEGRNVLDEAMTVLIRLRLEISKLVVQSLYPYDITPVLRLLECCESLYEGNELS